MDNIPIGYKKTDIGVIPEDWEVMPLINLLSEAPKYGINAAAVKHNPKFPTYLRITDIDENGRFNKLNKVSVANPQSHKYVLRKNEIVFARTGASVGKTYLYEPKDGQLVYAGFLIKILPNSNRLNAIYLKYFTQSKIYWKWISATSMRSGQPGINGNEYSHLPIISPSISEQTAIATVLSDIDSLISKYELLIQKKKRIKQGIMQELLTGKKRLKGFSGEWIKIRLGDMAEIIMGQSPDSKYYNKDSVGMPLIQGNADIVDRKQKLRVWTTFETKICFANSLIMTVRAPVGYIGITTNKSCLGRGVCAILPKDIEKHYLYYLLIFNEDSWKNFEQGSTFTSANNQQIIDFELLVSPSQEEQTAIANILSDIDKEIKTLETKLSKLKLIKQGAMQQLLTGKIRLLNK